MYWVYILRCKDKSYFAGIASDIHRALALHDAGKGSPYTKKRRPLSIVLTEHYSTLKKAQERCLNLTRLSFDELKSELAKSTGESLCC